MSYKTIDLNHSLSTDPDKLHQQVMLKNRKNSKRDVEFCPELRFPGDIPNPMIPHRAHRRSGSSPLSHYERVNQAQAHYEADELDFDE